jgi:carbon storage regulator
MLVLSRKAGEKICIGNGITLTVLSWKGNRVRLGIDAPPHVRIVREELVGLGKEPAGTRWREESGAADEPVLVEGARNALAIPR